MTIMIEDAANGYIVTCQGGKKLVYESLACMFNAVKDMLEPPKDPELRDRGNTPSPDGFWRSRMGGYRERVSIPASWDPQPYKSDNVARKPCACGEGREHV